MRFKLVYSDAYDLPIGSHVFTGQKYRHVHQLLIGSGAARPSDFVTPAPATDDDVRLVHTEDYVRKLREGTLSAQEEMLLELPFSPALVEAFWMHAGGSILAAELALRDGVAVSLGGGFHHAFPEHGEGFCMIHDVAIALRRLLRHGQAARAMVVDCDVHQGNGTAVIFNPSLPKTAPTHGWSAPPAQAARTVSVKEAEPGDVFTLSLHQENNYPQWKPPSSLDVNLPDRMMDAEYLDWLDNALNLALRQFAPDLIAYVAGADPYRDDQLGGLSLTMDGLKQRDEVVFATAKNRRIPIFATYAGGYAKNVQDTVRIHANTVIAAQEVFGSR
jgi:acetoin utilization deacetylase AcuC-like enzyme